MDTTKPSLSSKAPHVNNGWGTGTPLDEDQGRDPWRDGGEGERQKDAETKEAEVADGTFLTVETSIHHKQKFNTTSYQRRTKQKVVTDVATVSKGASAGSAKPRTALQALFSQGVSEKSPMPEERGQLDELKQVLETFVPGSLTWRWGEDSQGTTLESSWTHIVLSHMTMSKTQRHQQEALWEMVHTELTYINKLTVVKDLVIAALINLHQHGFLLEVTPELLFSNLPSILSAHCLFWQEVMYPMLHEVRRTGKPFDPLRLEAGCLQFHERFSCYVPYCWEEENTVEFTRRQVETSPHFLTFLQWVETNRLCERMRMGDMQAKPHQRITKYPLLLKAVLKTTQDPHVQTTLRGMLSSVNGFLESVNDYLRLKDEELALSISAQRVEGYEVEGISEDIDKHVRMICHFDLTCPIRGVGAGVIRKLLIEESLKIRGRKDSKLEVMALLFSDVLLMTKAQKKAERLKVVRPPLALDRTHCVALRDGCSFVLVEVSELGCAMNVYTFTTASPESCSKWVSTIYQQQETLRVLREKETVRLQLDRLPQFKNADNNETINQPTDQLREETFVAKLIEDPIVPQSINGTLASKRMETEYPPPDPVALNHTRLPGRHRKVSVGYSQSVCGGLAGRPIRRQQSKERDQWMETGMTGEPCGDHWKDGGGDGAELQWMNERRVTWNHSKESGSFPPSHDWPVKNKPNRPHSFLIEGYPDVDYPSPKPSTLDAPNRLYHPTGSVGQSEFQRTQRAVEIPTRRDSRSVEHQTRKDSWYSQSGEEEPPSDVWRFSRKLRSPRLRRRRPITSHHNVPPQVTRRGSGGSGTVWSALHTNSSSNSDSSNSDYSQKRRGHSAPSGQSSEPLVLKLGSLKLNRGELWYMPTEQVSQELKASSEPDLPNEMPRRNSCRRSKLKAQRSTSIPDIIIQGGHGHHRTSRSRPFRTEGLPSPPSGRGPSANPSPLEGLLERAKGRDHVGGKREGGGKTARFRTLSSPPPSHPLTRSPSPSEGDRDTEWEEVALMRHRALSVSQGWREARVDADEEKKCSPGVNVDWPGWCFDDEEVMDRLDYGVSDEGLLEGISRTLTLRDFQRIAVHEDGEISQV